MMVSVPLYPAVVAGRGTVRGPVCGTREIRDGEGEIGFQEGASARLRHLARKGGGGRSRHLNGK